MPKDHITLHPKLGVNPRLTFCPRCKGDTPELVLVGVNDRVHTCADCGRTCYGFKDHERCPVSSCKGPLRFERRLDDHERLPSDRPCEGCCEEIAKMDVIVDAGGVYFRCENCAAEGVLGHEHPSAIEARERSGIASGPLMIHALSCPACPKVN